MGRMYYRDGDEIALKANGCDGCSPFMVNGVLCHEPGCPYEHKDSGPDVNLTREPISEIQYVKNSGRYCPVCGSCAISGNEINYYYPGTLSQSMECMHCGAAWDDEYELAGYSDLKNEDGKYNWWDEEEKE